MPRRGKMPALRHLDCCFHSSSILKLGSPQFPYRNWALKSPFQGALTTYREGDKADTGHREILKQLGFAERELLIEFGYPTQRFVLPPIHMEDIQE